MMKYTLLSVILILFVSVKAQTSKYLDENLPIEERVQDLVSRMTLDEKCKQLLHEAPAISRLNIPAYNWWNEGLHGVARSGRATVFPQPIAMAATFDADLIKEIASAIGDEARAKHNAAIKLGNYTQYSGLTLWSPNVNIFRDPRWGRGMETFGEDPFLTSLLGAAFVKGLQGDHPRYLKTAACAKHFAVHSGPESERHTFDAYPPLRDLYETYLPAFEALVNSGVESVMCAYNRVYGEPACASNLFINEILRGKWNFKGHLLSDCWAIADFHNGHRVTQTAAQSVALALKSGVELNCGSTYRTLPQALEEGLITEKDIDKAISKLYETLFKLGFFDSSGNNPYSKMPESVVNSEKHKDLARKAAQKSIVLLKNKNTLPLNKQIKHLYVMGPNASDVDVLLGNYNGQTADARTIIEGIAEKVDLGTRLEYRKGFMYNQMNLNERNSAIPEAKEADAVIVVLGLNPVSEGEEGEAIASDYGSDRRNMNLPENQLYYLREVRSAVQKPLIVIVTGGSPINLKEVYDLSDALLFAWYPGEQGGVAVADILFGNVSPTGKLPITFPMNESHLPDYRDYSMKGRTYKYSSHVPLFPFGFGLGYGSFELSDMIIKDAAIRNNGVLKISFTAHNSGQAVIREVVQLYINTQDSKIETPLFDLKNVMNIELAPGEYKNFTFVVPAGKLYNYNNEGDKVWIKGQHNVYVATSLPITRSLELGAPKWLQGSLVFK